MTLPGMKKPLKPIPVFKQMPGEKKKQFFRRMDLTVQVRLEFNHILRILGYTFQKLNNSSLILYNILGCNEKKEI